VKHFNEAGIAGRSALLKMRSSDERIPSASIIMLMLILVNLVQPGCELAGANSGVTDGFGNGEKSCQ
jgi:hypothetical protein